MTLYLYGLAMFWSMTAVIALGWAVRSGQFEDAEVAKYHMLAAARAADQEQGFPGS